MAFTVSKFVDWGLGEREVVAGGGLRGDCAALVFEARAWEGFGARKRFFDWVKSGWLRRPYNDAANCYAYALGDLSLFVSRFAGWARPGAIAGKPIKGRSATAAQIIRAAEKDGLTATGNRLEIEKQSRPVALFICDAGDYHWLRLDWVAHSSQMVWTHKFRNRKPEIVVGKNGKPLADIRRLKIAYKGGKEDRYRFVSFFTVPSDLAVAPTVIKKYGFGARLLRRELRTRRPDDYVLIPQLG